MVTWRVVHRISLIIDCTSLNGSMKGRESYQSDHWLCWPLYCFCHRLIFPRPRNSILHSTARNIACKYWNLPSWTRICGKSMWMVMSTLHSQHCPASLVVQCSRTVLAVSTLKALLLWPVIGLVSASANQLGANGSVATGQGLRWDDDHSVWPRAGLHQLQPTERELWDCLTSTLE